MVECGAGGRETGRAGTQSRDAKRAAEEQAPGLRMQTGEAQEGGRKRAAKAGGESGRRKRTAEAGSKTGGESGRQAGGEAGEIRQKR